MLCGHHGIRAAFFLGRRLNERERRRLSFCDGKTPCHATLTETLRVIDAAAPADILGAACPPVGADARHGKIDGKTMRASKDGDGNATHVLSAFCTGSRVNRSHWGIEIMHRDKAVTLGEDGYTNRSDNAPRNVFSRSRLKSSNRSHRRQSAPSNIFKTTETGSCDCSPDKSRVH